jgi:hypothetical protein
MPRALRKLQAVDKERMWIGERWRLKGEKCRWKRRRGERGYDLERMRCWKRRLFLSILHLVDMDMDTVMRAMITGTDMDMDMGKQVKALQCLGRQWGMIGQIYTSSDIMYCINLYYFLYDFYGEPETPI